MAPLRPGFTRVGVFSLAPALEAPTAENGAAMPAPVGPTPAAETPSETPPRIRPALPAAASGASYCVGDAGSARCWASTAGVPRPPSVREEGPLGAGVPLALLGAREDAADQSNWRARAEAADAELMYEAFSMPWPGDECAEREGVPGGLGDASPCAPAHGGEAPPLTVADPPPGTSAGGPDAETRAPDAVRRHQRSTSELLEPALEGAWYWAAGAGAGAGAAAAVRRREAIAKLCSWPMAGDMARRRAATGAPPGEMRVRAAAAPAAALLPLLAAEDCPDDRRLCPEGGDGEGSTLRMLAASYTTGAKGDARPVGGGVHVLARGAFRGGAAVADLV